MSSSFLDHSQNLQINGDVNFISSGGPAQGNHNFLQVTQHVQSTNAHSRTIERGFKILCDNTAPSARYGFGHSFTRPQCHPGTRVAVQDHIFKWLEDEDGTIAMWMNGPVGIGKSAIAQTVAHMAAERGQLSSAFFFFRTDEARNSAKHLVATLAYEMTQQIPSTLEPVCLAIAANPLIFYSPLEHQINTILLRPLSTTSASSLRVHHRLVVIDGLDECLETNAQQDIILSFISNLLSVSTKIIPHRILIVSRPESHITSSFSDLDIRYHVKHLALESWDTEDDIGIFLRAKLDKIQQTHPLRRHLPGLWPDRHSFSRLRELSIGSFAYASVVIRHLASHNHSPERALQDLLSLRPSRAVAAFADLDALYRHILLALNPEVRFTLQKVLCLSAYSSWKDIDDLASILSEETSVVEVALICKSSLIQIHDRRRSIKFHHSSFEEFLWDKERSGDLYIFYPTVASAVSIALSSLWLRPISNMGLYGLFRTITARLDCLDGLRKDFRLEDMNVHVINTLIATKLPASFFYDTPRQFTNSFLGPVQNVAEFCMYLQWKSQRHSEPIQRYRYNQAFTIVCDWLRSLFWLFFQETPTAKDILDILLEFDVKPPWLQLHPFMGVFTYLTKNEYKSFHCLCQVFPTIDQLDLYSEILDRYVAMVLRQHNGDLHTTNNFPDPAKFLKELYIMACNGVKLSGFSQRLETMVSEGMKALGLVPDMYVTPQQCIFRFFCGHGCIGVEYHLAIARRKASDINKWPPKTDYLSLAEKTDLYIRQTHMEQDFPYLSKTVEALYHVTSPAPLNPGF